MSAASFLLLQQVMRSAPGGVTEVPPGWTPFRCGNGYLISSQDHATFDRWHANTAAMINAITTGLGNTAVECKPCGATIEAHEHACSYCKTPRP